MLQFSALRGLGEVDCAATPNDPVCVEIYGAPPPPAPGTKIAVNVNKLMTAAAAPITTLKVGSNVSAQQVTTLPGSFTLPSTVTAALPTAITGLAPGTKKALLWGGGILVGLYALKKLL
jgi:hypothetical protein